MKLKLLAGGGGHAGCAGKHCPTVYQTDRGTLVVQGYTVTEPTNASVDTNETLVEVPMALLTELLGQL